MKKHIVGIFILAVIMVALPHHLRFSHNNPTAVGVEPYYHARFAMDMADGISETDSAIVNERPYIFNPYHLVLSFGYALLGPLAFTLLPALFALASFIFLWFLLKSFKIPEITQSWVLLTYALSPPLIAAGTIGTPHAFVLALILSGAWLLSNNWWLLGVVFFIVASLSGTIYNVAALVFLLVLFLVPKADNKRITTALVFSGLIFIIGYNPPTISVSRGILQSISDFGGTYGLSIFAFLLAIVGATLVWKHKRTYYGAYAVMFAYLIASFFFTDQLVFANVIISVLAGIAFSTLAQRKWQLTFLRQGALLVLFCGLLFSSISHASTLADMQPTPAFFKALEFAPGTVLTHQQYGFWVEAAGHTAVIDPLWTELPEPEEQLWDVSTLFSSTDITKTHVLLNKYGVTHILITPEMQHGFLWEREEQGLAFLVKNSETFKKVETGSNIGVWRVT